MFDSKQQNELLSLDPTTMGMTAEGIVRLCDDELALAAQFADEIRSLCDAPLEALTWQETLGKFDRLTHALSSAVCFAQLMSLAHPDEGVRIAAKTCEPKVDAFSTAIYLDAHMFRVFQRYADKQEAVSTAQRRLLEFTLRDYHRNGLNLPVEGQKRLMALNEEMTRLGQEFESNLAEATSAIEVTQEQLAGLPPNYVASRLPGENGKIRITTDYPDSVPFLTYAEDREAARELSVLQENRAKEKNLPILDRLIALRHQKALVLGYPTWADYVLETRMAKNAKTVRAFIDDLHRDLQSAARAECDVYRRAYAEHTGKQDVTLWQSDRRYLQEIAQRRECSFDSQKLTEYFEGNMVLQGILDIASDLYGLRFERITVPTWHDDVVALDVFDMKRNEIMGRAYLDLYPRADKYKHAAVFTLQHTMRLEDKTRVMPVAALVCNFPKPGGAAPALLAHDEVTTFFHEFGHLLHDLLSETELSHFSCTSVARDFVEVPSQLFEEWAWTRETLDRFARHHLTGERIPDDIFAAMQKSRRFGEALATERQLFLADLDLTYHTSIPGFDTTEVMLQLHPKYSPLPRVPGTYFQATFGHLVGYDAGYYGYQWALSMAKDVFTRFDREGVMSPVTAAEYRSAILARGGEEDEEKMVQDFLGRPANNDAYKKFLGIMTIE